MGGGQGGVYPSLHTALLEDFAYKII